jgi:hypothetical protein
MRTDLSTFANTVYRRFTCIREDDMAGGNSSWADRWRGFLGFSPGTTRRALEILSQRYIEESQHIERYNEHARKMQYPPSMSNGLRSKSNLSAAECLVDRFGGKSGSDMARAGASARASLTR